MKRMNTKLFRNGGSWAVRLPSDWIVGSPDVQLIEKRPGVIEVHLLSRQQLFSQLIEDTIADPLSESDLPVEERQLESDRYDIEKLMRGSN